MARRPEPEVVAGGALRDGVFSCVVDRHPRFHLDALRWYASLTRVAGVAPAALVVHTVGSGPSDVTDFLRAEGVAVRPVEAFDSRSPHCNKIAGALRLAEDSIDGTAVLCDTDTVFVEDPRVLRVPSTTVAGKLVDAPVPPLDVLSTIFAQAGLPLPPTAPLTGRPGATTVAGNFNGGLYLIPGDQLAAVATGWSTWARWLLERRSLLSASAIYVDQVAMALCLAEMGLDPAALEPRWNTPIHDPSNLPPATTSPAMIHYHQEVDRRGLVRGIDVAVTDQAIVTVNRAVRTLFDEARPDDTYRRWLTETGQRGEFGARAEATAAAVDRLIRVLQPSSVLEMDGEGHRAVADPRHRVTGAAAGSAGPPDGAQADLILCLDRVTKEAEPDGYRALLRRLWRASARALVVTGYEEPPDLDDRDGHFHEPLSVTLRETAPDAEIYRVLTDAPMATYFVLRPPADPHPRDYGPPTLDRLAERHPDLLGLAVLRVHARGTTTFYPDHAPRLWEYPTVAALLTAELAPGSELVDVGAGVTPLAPFLTSRGYVVDTVDPSPVHREWPPQPEWNEWDYLDYGAAGLVRRSWNCGLEELPARRRFDGVYSVSVIEHVAAAGRRRLLAEMAARLRRGGVAVLTIDLVRGSSDLWNRNLGVDVEDPAVHGTFDDVILEARRVGLALFRRETVREWGDVDVDIGLLAFRKESTPWTAQARRLADRWRAGARRPWA